MKLKELGLTSKPQTHYFQGGFISFAVRNGFLQYKITTVSKTGMATLDNGIITSKDELEALLLIKHLDEVLA